MSLLFATRLFHEFYMLKNSHGAPLFDVEKYRPRQTSITWNFKDNQTFYYDNRKVSVSSSDDTQRASHSISTKNSFIYLEPESESEDETENKKLK